jgi:hypothetical protein
MKRVETIRCTIFCGLREEYDGPVHSINMVEDWLQLYCNEVGLCVTIKPTKFIYKGDNEKGVEIGLINYPRFPSTKEKILEHAHIICENLILMLNQHRVSIVFDDETIMIERDGDIIVTGEYNE